MYICMYTCIYLYICMSYGIILEASRPEKMCFGLLEEVPGDEVSGLHELDGGAVSLGGPEYLSYIITRISSPFSSLPSTPK